MGAALLSIALWAAHFAVAYGFTAFACARQMAGAIPWVVGVATIAALAATAAVAVPAAMRAARFPDFLAAGLGALAAIAIAWEASSLLWVPACE